MVQTCYSFDIPKELQFLLVKLLAPDFGDVLPWTALKSFSNLVLHGFAVCFSNVQNSFTKLRLLVLNFKREENTFILGHLTICPICIGSALFRHLCCFAAFLTSFYSSLKLKPKKLDHLVDAYEMCIQMDLFMDNKQQERSWKQDITVQGTVEFLSIPHSDIVKKPEVLENEHLDEIFCIDILAKKGAHRLDLERHFFGNARVWRAHLGNTQKLEIARRFCQTHLCQT